MPADDSRGETPVFERMTVESYLDWLELYGVVDEAQR